MATPHVAQRGPYVIEEKAGKRTWCACGLSKKQPYCDGSHKGSGIVPVFVEIKQDQKVAWCGCKQSGNKPYCDGTHSRLPQS